MPIIKPVPQDQKLPETPFNGIVTSIVEVSAGGYSYRQIVIADLDAPTDRPRVAFLSVHIGRDAQPIAHLKEGHRVKVKKVELSEDGEYVFATEVVLDASALASMAAKRANRPVG